jgi:hypothetical protein
LAQELEEGGEIAVFVEDGTAAIPPVEDMVTVAAQRYSWVSWHEGDYRDFCARRQAKSTLSPFLVYFVGAGHWGFSVWAHNANCATKGAAQATLDWSIVSGTGETRQAHVALHEGNNVQKQIHGIFYGDAVEVTNEAWATAQQQGITAHTVGGVDIYVVPRPNSGWAGGYAGQGQNLNTVTIITQSGTNKIITSYPGNGAPLPRP